MVAYISGVDPTSTTPLVRRWELLPIGTLPEAGKKFGEWLDLSSPAASPIEPSSSRLKIPEYVDNNDALVCPPSRGRNSFQRAEPRLVVERRLPPMANHELGDKYSDLPVSVRVFDFQDVIDQRHRDEAVGGRSRLAPAEWRPAARTGPTTLCWNMVQHPPRSLRRRRGPLRCGC